MKHREDDIIRWIIIGISSTALIIFIIWVTFVYFQPPVQSKFIDEKNEIKDPMRLMVKARTFHGTKRVDYEKEINLSNAVAYVDMWKSHWCTYYNDREFFFTPRINEMLQRLRTFNVPIVTISSNADDVYLFTKQRRVGRKLVKMGSVPELVHASVDQRQNHFLYIPKFQDVCIYEDLQRFGYARDNRLSPKIMLTDDDIFVQNFKEAAEAFVGLGRKQVIIFGQHTNMCLMAVILFCRKVGLELTIVRDLVDACWVYNLEKEYAANHTEGNNVNNVYFDSEYGSSVLSYDLMREMNKLKVEREKPNYTLFTNTAYRFKNV